MEGFFLIVYFLLNVLIYITVYKFKKKSRFINLIENATVISFDLVHFLKIRGFENMYVKFYIVIREIVELIGLFVKQVKLPQRVTCNF